MNMKKKTTIFITILAFLVSLTTPINVANADENLVELSFVGPGRFDTDLMIVDGGETIGDYFNAGILSIYNTRDDLVIECMTEEDWEIKELTVYIEEDRQVLASNILENDSDGYFITKFNLYDDLAITWGQRDEEERLMTLSVKALLVNDSVDNGSVKEAWAVGNVDSEDGTWLIVYAIVHPLTGHFIDAPVGNIGYSTPTENGITDDKGAFDYMLGDNVALYLGEYLLGVTLAKDKVTPIDLAGPYDYDHTIAVNMARLLQSFDDNGDPQTGIFIDDETIAAFENVMDSFGLVALDFSDSETIEAIIDTTNALLGGRLTVVSEESALENLNKGTGSNLVRKNVSKSSEALNAKAKLELMNIYVPSQKANGDPVTLEYYKGEKLVEERNVAKPLVSCYTEEIPGTGAYDVFAAISRDEGETWSRTNLSKSADKSSFKLENGYDFPGSVKKPQIRVKGNYIVASWTSTYARTGRPTYAIKIGDSPDDQAWYPFDNPYYEEDIWGVSGPQRSVDYAELGYPEVGEIPYSVVWSARGVVDKNSGEITWYKPERLTSGRRDAYQLAMNGVEGVGFALVWQEDPEGLMPGEEAGPGEGWSGATTSHKTDIWYSYVLWDDFEEVDENFVANGVLDEDVEDEDLNRRPKALVPFTLPVRISDNDVVNTDSMKAEYSPHYGESVPEEEQITQDDIEALEEGDVIEVDSSFFAPVLDDDPDSEGGAHRYAYEKLPSYYKGPVLTSRLMASVNQQGVKKYIAITGDGRVLDGDSGASRPNIMMQKYIPEEGNGQYNGDPNGEATGIPSPSSWVVICYEETKGAGSGQPEEDDTTTEYVSGGQQIGQTRYVPDEGKNVIYHTFEMTQPDLVSGGTIINPQVQIDSEEERAYYISKLPEALQESIEPGYLPGEDDETHLLYLVDDQGAYVYDWQGNKLPSYENARRPRMIIQGITAAHSKKEEGDLGTPLVMVYKMGEDGKGRPSDIMMQRFLVPVGYESLSLNPYDPDFRESVQYNISAMTPAVEMENEDRSASSNGEGIKVLEWHQDESNLDDDTWENNYEDARAHRGIIRGDMLAIAYDYTANWSAARNGNDVYNLYLRRSFNGGEDFTTNPSKVGVEHVDYYKVGIGAGVSSDEREEELTKEVVTFYEAGEFEPARNLSHFVNNQETVIEPRLVGGPSTIYTDDPSTEAIEKASDKAFFYAEDKRNINTFWITFGTSSNPGDGGSMPKLPLDLYYSYTTDFGDTFYDITKTVSLESDGNYAGEEKVVWDWLAKDTGTKEAEQMEAQIRMSPNGKTFYAVWNEKSEDSSDVMFRRIMLNDQSVDSVIDMVDTVPPVIRIIGVHDGNRVSDPVNVSVYLNELGSWTAELTKNDTTVTYTDNFIVPVEDGVHEYGLKVTAVDISGNTTVEDLSFTIDSNAPSIEIVGVTEGEESNEPITIDVLIDADSSEIVLTKNGGVIPFEGPMTVSEEGRYELSVTASRNGFTSNAIVPFVIDLTPPVIKVTGVEDGKTYLGSVRPDVVVTDPNTSMTANDDLSSYEILLNGRPYLPNTRITEAGDYVLSVFAEDNAGNISESKTMFSLRKSSSSSNKVTSTIDIEDQLLAQAGFIDLTHLAVTGVIPAGIETTIAPETFNIRVFVPENTFEEDVVYVITPQTIGAAEGAHILELGDYIYKVEFFDGEGSSITEFDSDIQVSFIFDDDNLPFGFEHGEAYISYYDESLNGGLWVVVPSEERDGEDGLGAWVDHLTSFSALAIKGFPNLEDCCGHWAEEDIYKLASLGIIHGDENGYASPEDLITREEMAKILVNALGYDPGTEPIFTDASDVADWAQGFVETAERMGLMQNDELNRFRPKDYATRSEVVFAAQNGFKVQNKVYEGKAFEDEAYIDPKHLSTINLMVANGILDGYPDNTFRPDGEIKRGELFKIIVRYLALNSDTDEVQE